VTNELFLIIGMFIATFSTRFVLFAMADRIQFPSWLSQALGYVPPVVLTTIIIPAVVMPKGEVWLDWDNAWLIAAVVAALTSLISRNLLITIVTGMFIFLLVRLVQSS